MIIENNGENNGDFLFDNMNGVVFHCRSYINGGLFHLAWDQFSMIIGTDGHSLTFRYAMVFWGERCLLSLEW